MFPPKPSDIFSPEGGCSEGLDAFTFFLTGPLFPIGIEHLIYMKFSVTVRHMVIKGI